MLIAYCCCWCCCLPSHSLDSVSLSSRLPAEKKQKLKTKRRRKEDPTSLKSSWNNSQVGISLKSPLLLLNRENRQSKTLEKSPLHFLLHHLQRQMMKMNSKRVIYKVAGQQQQQQPNVKNWLNCRNEQAARQAGSQSVWRANGRQVDQLTAGRASSQKKWCKQINKHQHRLSTSLNWLVSLLLLPLLSARSIYPATVEKERIQQKKSPKKQHWWTHTHNIYRST